MSSLLWLIPQAFFSILLLYLCWRSLSGSESPDVHAVAILVLGDLGRSPRMMNHAESFANNGYETYLIGFPGSQLIPSLLTNPRMRVVHLRSIPKLLSILPFILLAPLKIAWQCASILFVLTITISRPPKYLMVQNPPSIPTLILAWFICKTRGSELIIDWHNLGYTILALRLGSNHILVKLAQRIEAFFGKKAFLHLFVTKAMRNHLTREWGLQGQKVVFHDRPPARFHRALPTETHDLFLQLDLSRIIAPGFLPTHNLPITTPITSMDDHASAPRLRHDRPALVLTSTSWTPDEDFSILLEALTIYEQSARNKTLPKLLMLVTGKGPLKEEYMKKILKLEAEEGWEWVRCQSLWLEPDDYPTLLGSADLGVCLHSSSSAMDLPMKVVDMFGCGLPVCALYFDCLPELVKHGQNGLIFKSAVQLAEQLESLLDGFPACSNIESLRKSLEVSSERSPSSVGVEWCTWEQNWDRVIRPLLQGHRNVAVAREG